MWLAPAGEASGKDEDEVGDVEKGSAGPAAEPSIQMKWAYAGLLKQKDIALFKETVLASGFSLQALQVGASKKQAKDLLLVLRHPPASIAASAVGAALTATALGATRVFSGCCHQRPGYHRATAAGLLTAWPRTHFTCRPC